LISDSMRVRPSVWSEGAQDPVAFLLSGGDVSGEGSPTLPTDFQSLQLTMVVAEEASEEGNGISNQSS